MTAEILPSKVFRRQRYSMCFQMKNNEGKCLRTILTKPYGIECTYIYIYIHSKVTVKKVTYIYQNWWRPISNFIRKTKKRGSFQIMHVFRRNPSNFDTFSYQLTPQTRLKENFRQRAFNKKFRNLFQKIGLGVVMASVIQRCFFYGWVTHNLSENFQIPKKKPSASHTSSQFLTTKKKELYVVCLSLAFRLVKRRRSIFKLNSRPKRMFPSCERFSFLFSFFSKKRYFVCFKTRMLLL